jgi:hypothetical protein
MLIRYEESAFSIMIWPVNHTIKRVFLLVLNLLPVFGNVSSKWLMVVASGKYFEKQEGHRSAHNAAEDDFPYCMGPGCYPALGNNCCNNK